MVCAGKVSACTALSAEHGQGAMAWPASNEERIHIVENRMLFIVEKLTKKIFFTKVQKKIPILYSVAAFFVGWFSIAEHDKHFRKKRKWQLVPRILLLLEKKRISL
jgi:hypothetical protein